MQGNVTAVPSRHTSLYRFFDSNGSLLYVGISFDLPTRWVDHSSSKPWWHCVDTATIEHYPDRGTAEAAERHAIKTENPAWNVLHRSSKTASSEARPRPKQPVAPALTPTRLIRVGQAAKMLRGITTAAVHRYAEAGLLKSKCVTLNGERRFFEQSVLELKAVVDMLPGPEQDAAREALRRRNLGLPSDDGPAAPGPAAEPVEGE